MPNLCLDFASVEFAARKIPVHRGDPKHKVRSHTFNVIKSALGIPVPNGDTLLFLITTETRPAKQVAAGPH